MKLRFVRAIALFLCLCSLFSGVVPTAAATDTGTTEYHFTIREPIPNEENDPNDPDAAQNISGFDLITEISGFAYYDYLFNKQTRYGAATAGNASLTLEHEDGIGWLYFIFGKEYGAYTVTNNDTGESATCGENMFLHETIDLTALFGGPVRSVTVDFSNGAVSIYEIYAYTEGYLPDYVQAWEPAKEDKTDLILFSTHGDDDQLFFAGLLPYYCALDYEVLVVYLTDHRNNHTVRIHEMLNGLWAVGVTTYPVFGDFADFFAETLNGTYTTFSYTGVSKEDIVGFVLEQLRRYKPQVVIGHDFNGEYGHGQHMVYADCLAAALEISNDPEQYPELADTYGVWDVPKAYFHLYEENQVVMDWDTPMEELDGMTPFKVTQLLGYPHHISQRESWVSDWINGRNYTIDRADQITRYSPCLYGLYRTTVGPDAEKNDFFENLNSYAEQERLAEEARLAEEVRLAEEARQEEERRKAEEAEQEARQAAEEEARRLAEEEAKRQEEEARVQAALQQEADRKRDLIIFICLGVAVAGLLIIAAVLLLYKPKRNKKAEKKRKKATGKK